jgi:hypothetical protein
MAKVVDHLRECFPGVAILIISTADKSTKYGTEMKTDSAVVPLTLAQKRYAVQTESAYVNLYTLMGGDGSMVKWVDEAPAQANKDYTHFNFRGSKKISDLIYKQLNEGYIKYKKLRGVTTPEPVEPAEVTPVKPVRDSFKTVTPAVQQPLKPTVNPTVKPATGPVKPVVVPAKPVETPKPAPKKVAKPDSIIKKDTVNAQ